MEFLCEAARDPVANVRFTAVALETCSKHAGDEAVATHIRPLLDSLKEDGDDGVRAQAASAAAARSIFASWGLGHAPIRSNFFYFHVVGDGVGPSAPTKRRCPCYPALPGAGRPPRCRAPPKTEGLRLP